ncbi:ogr/Delta-like zinc finger family protein [Marinomonas sp. PE14-40]|uniref:ogr/Delta-like zinc finger family protein n=1 Tax=Marinomonas sp. PE14-40 TaxID=3060621 RepID=UPI003F67AF4A
MSFRVECPNCGSKAVIHNNANVGKEIEGVFMKDLYCRCTNLKDCGCTFVVSASFSHYLNPPQRDVVDLAKEILRKENQLTLGGMGS